MQKESLRLRSNRWQNQPSNSGQGPRLSSLPSVFPVTCVFTFAPAVSFPAGPFLTAMPVGITAAFLDLSQKSRPFCNLNARIALGSEHEFLEGRKPVGIIREFQCLTRCLHSAHISCPQVRKKLPPLAGGFHSPAGLGSLSYWLRHPSRPKLSPAALPRSPPVSSSHH